MSRKRRATTAAGALTAATTVLALLVAAPSASAQPGRGVYTVHGAGDTASRTAVARTGVDLFDVSGDAVSVIASPAQADRLRAAGFTVELTGDFDAMLRERSTRHGTPKTGAPDTAAEFPPGDEGYHTYDEMVAELDQTAADHPGLASVSSIGSSYEGRDIPIIKISDNARADESEPEVIFTCNMHAREHLTTEMCLHIVSRFTDGYGTDAAVTSFVDGLEIWVVPSQNPDGAEYDIQGGEYAGWRKNRQPNADGSIGTDTNRNFPYKWGCCGGSSGNGSSQTYRGASAASAPEVRAMTDFVDSRVVDGRQQITAHIDFHTYSELVLWPFGFTYEDVTEGLDEEEAARFQDVGTRMAQTNGYTPQQSSDLYITDGTIQDWMWGQHKIFSFTFEMYPSSGGIDGFYPPDEVIAEQTARNDAAVDILLGEAG